MSDGEQSRWREGAAIAAIVGLVFAALSLRPPASSELRYVAAAREMVGRGDWLVPHLAGVPYLEKPVLLYWCAAAAQRLFGEGAIACRLPSILAGAGTALIAWMLARELRPPPFPRLAVTALTGSGLFLMFGSVLVTDPLLAFLLWAAWYAFWRFDARGGWGPILAFWAALGLAALAKGPIAVVMAGISIALYVVVAGRCGRLRWPLPVTVLGWPALALARQAGRMRMAVGLPLLAAINLAWWWPVWHRDPRLVGFFFVRENLRGFVDGSVNHEKPWWLYGAVACVALAPFAVPGTLALIGPVAARFGRALRAAFVERRPGATDDGDRLRLYLACIIVPNLLVLTASRSKQEYYLLPLVPALVLLAVDALLIAPGGWRRWATTAQAAALALAAAGTAIALPMLRARQPRLAGVGDGELIAACAALALLAVGCAVAAVAAWRQRIAAALAWMAAATIAAFALLSPVALAFRHDLDDRGLADRVAGELADDDAVVLAHANVTDYTTLLRLRRPRLSYYGPLRELGMGHWVEATSAPLPEDPYAISGEDLGDEWLWQRQRLIDEWRGERRVWLIGDEALLAELRGEGLEPEVLSRMGRRVLMRNR